MDGSQITLRIPDKIEVPKSRDRFGRFRNKNGLSSGEAVEFPLIVKDRKFPGKWRDYETFESSKHGTCKTVFAAAAWAKIPWLVLYKGLARFNDGEKVFSFNIKPPIPGAHPKVRVYHLKRLSKPAEKYRNAQEPKGRPLVGMVNDDAYVTVTQLWDGFANEKGERPWKRRRDLKAWCRHWRNRESKIRPGKKVPGENAALRARQEILEAGGCLGRMKPWKHRIGDVSSILAGKEDLYPAQRGPEDDDAKLLIETYVREVGPIRSIPLRAFCRTNLIGAPQQKRLMKALRMRPNQVGSQRHRFWCLPGQSAPDALDHSPIRRKTIAFLKETLSHGEKSLQDLIDLGRSLRISKHNLFDAKPHAGVVSRWEWAKPDGGRQRYHFAMWKLVNRTGSKSAEPIADPGLKNGKDPLGREPFKAQTHLPALASAPELAALINQPNDPVESFLRRYRNDHRDCFQPVDNPRRNEPRILYRVADVWEPLQAHFA